MHIDLQDQVALVTGAAHRVGKAIALELARRGVNIIAHYHRSDDEAVKETLRDIKSLGVSAFAVQADISASDGVDAIFEAVREHFGRLHILVNSASAFIKGTLLETSLEDWELSMRVNMTGAFLCTKAAVPLMRENDPPGGAIVNICDKGAISPWPSFAAHGISKAGLHALSEASAIEFAPDIRTNAVIPGAVLKPEYMSDDDWNKSARQNVPLQRSGAADDVARAVAYLVSESFINGVTIRVDGGEYVL
jgi:NAD(P)-dependent dehydrogenase (short-subunit alcohol dehydrogenase family)